MTHRANSGKPIGLDPYSNSSCVEVLRAHLVKVVFMAYLWVGLVMVFGKNQRCGKKLYVKWLRGNYAKTFPRPLSFFSTITWPMDLQI